MEKRELLSPSDDTASRALIDVQTATTRVKAIISECVSKGIPDDELTKRLNEVIAVECKRIKDAPFREQFRKALITSARKWHYQLMQTYRINEQNFANAVKRQPLNVELKNLLGKTPFQKQFEFRRILDDGTNPGIPVIRDYQKGLKLAVRAISAEPPKIITPKNGKAYVMSARLRAEMAVRYSAAVDSLQRLIDDGVNWCWISSHPNCSERCKDFQGKLYSLFDKPKEIDGKTYNPSGTVDGIPYEYIGKALAGPKNDGNGCISGYNCRHRAIAYEKGSRAPADYTDAEIKKAYAIDKQQRSYENRIRHLKQEEAQLRACGMTEEAKALRKKWRVLTRDYQIYSIQNNRAYYPYRYIVDRTEVEEGYVAQFNKWQQDIGKENMPETVDKFKEMVYNNNEEYRLLKHYHFARTTGRISALADFKLFKDIKQTIESITQGKNAANGVEIKAVSLHCVDRVIGTIYGKIKHEGMSLDVFQKILFTGTVSNKIKYNKAGAPSQNIKIEGLGIITVNPHTGELIQCNRTT